ncbi:MAG: hypothetical protein ABJN34_03305 [Litoreibacter sp.]|uniref:hypothetical protein n=1 Tax=Litoreibacter sp. TaxID=1969459 RepID=UPI0032992E5B
MKLYINTVAGAEPDPYDLGRIHLRDEATRLCSEDAKPKSDYLVYVELLNLFGAAMTACINSTKTSYTLPDGSRLACDGSKLTAKLEFQNVKLDLDLLELLIELKDVLQVSFNRLSNYSDTNDSLFLDIVDALEDSQNV